MKPAILAAFALVGASLGGAVVPAVAGPGDEETTSGGEIEGDWYYPPAADDGRARSPLAPLWDPWVVSALLLLGTGVAVAIERRAAPPDDGEAETPSPVERRRRAVGKSAGDFAEDLAADRDADVLFRSWLALADELGVADPETVGRDRLRERALDAGLDGEDAERLADQYDVLRYGGAATTDREREAIEVLQAIERRHAGTDGTSENEGSNDDGGG